MCQGLSGIIVRSRKSPYWVEGVNSHSEIIGKYSLHGDNTDCLAMCSQLPYEFLLVAAPTDIFDPTQWVWSIDADTEHLPSWYTDEAHEYEDAARADHLIPQLAAWKATGKYPGYLSLHSVTTLPKGCTFNVGGDLYLHNVTTLPKGCTFNGGEYLYLNSVTTLPKGCTFNVGDDLYLNSVTKKPNMKQIKVRGTVYGGW